MALGASWDLKSMAHPRCLRTKKATAETCGGRWLHASTTVFKIIPRQAPAVYCIVCVASIPYYRFPQLQFCMPWLRSGTQHLSLNASNVFLGFTSVPCGYWGWIFYGDNKPRAEQCIFCRPRLAQVAELLIFDLSRPKAAPVYILTSFNP